MTLLKMRAFPDPELLDIQRKKVMLINNMKRGGFGWEDIWLELRRQKMPTPADQVRNFVLRPRS